MIPVSKLYRVEIPFVYFVYFVVSIELLQLNRSLRCKVRCLPIGLLVKKRSAESSVAESLRFYDSAIHRSAIFLATGAICQPTDRHNSTFNVRCSPFTVFPLLLGRPVLRSRTAEGGGEGKVMSLRNKTSRFEPLNRPRQVGRGVLTAPRLSVASSKSGGGVRTPSPTFRFVGRG